MYVVRADSFWYKFKDIESAVSQYDYIFNNLDGKYSKINKLYLAEYNDNKTNPKLLKFWTKLNQGGDL